MLKHQIFCSFFFVTALIGSSKGQCQEDFTPCSCSNYPSGWQVTCNQIPMADVSQVFSRSSFVNGINALFITPPPTDDIIPMDLLATKTINALLQLACPSSSYNLKVDPNAFRSTRERTKSFQIVNCNTSQVDFIFLNGFSRLDSLGISSSSQVHQSLTTLPLLDNLSTFTVTTSSGLNDWTTFPILVKGLTSISLMNNVDLTEAAVDRILKWVLVTSADTLQEIMIQGNQLTQIPQPIKSFRQLNSFYALNNAISVVNSGSLSFSSPVHRLDLSDSKITKIEPAAFQGNFSYAYVSLFLNQLTRFEASVFQTMLQQMANTAYGNLDLQGNPFDCNNDPCHLAWLIRDNPELLKETIKPSCSNGTSFADLDPNAFNNCEASTFVCPGNGNYQNPNSPCGTTFYICSNGVAHPFECPSNLVLNPTIGYCDYSSNVDGCNSV